MSDCSGQPSRNFNVEASGWRSVQLVGGGLKFEIIKKKNLLEIVPPSLIA